MAADMRDSRARGCSCAGRCGQLHRRFDGVNLVVLIVDGEVAIQTYPFAVASQNASAHGVESAHGYGFAGAQHQAIQTFAHFAGGFVGEGYGENPPRRNAAFFHEVSDAVSDDSGSCRSRGRRR